MAFEGTARLLPVQVDAVGADAPNSTSVPAVLTLSNHDSGSLLASIQSMHGGKSAEAIIGGGDSIRFNDADLEVVWPHVAFACHSEWQFARFRAIVSDAQRLFAACLLQETLENDVDIDVEGLGDFAPPLNTEDGLTDGSRGTPSSIGAKPRGTLPKPAAAAASAAYAGEAQHGPAHPPQKRHREEDSGAAAAAAEAAAAAAMWTQQHRAKQAQQQQQQNPVRPASSPPPPAVDEAAEAAVAWKAAHAAKQQASHAPQAKQPAGSIAETGGAPAKAPSAPPPAPSSKFVAVTSATGVGDAALAQQRSASTPVTHDGGGGARPAPVAIPSAAAAAAAVYTPSLSPLTADQTRHRYLAAARSCFGMRMPICDGMLLAHASSSSASAEGGSGGATTTAISTATGQVALVDAAAPAPAAAVDGGVAGAVGPPPLPFPHTQGTDWTVPSKYRHKYCPAITADSLARSARLLGTIGFAAMTAATGSGGGSAATASSFEAGDDAGVAAADADHGYNGRVEAYLSALGLSDWRQSIFTTQLGTLQARGVEINTAPLPPTVAHTKRQCAYCYTVESLSATRRRVVGLHPLVPCSASKEPVWVCLPCMTLIIERRQHAARLGRLLNANGHEDLCAMCGLGKLDEARTSELVSCCAAGCPRSYCKDCIELVVNSHQRHTMYTYHKAKDAAASSWLCPPCELISADQLAAVQVTASMRHEQATAAAGTGAPSSSALTVVAATAGGQVKQKQPQQQQKRQPAKAPPAGAESVADGSTQHPDKKQKQQHRPAPSSATAASGTAPGGRIDDDRSGGSRNAEVAASSSSAHHGGMAAAAAGSGGGYGTAHAQAAAQGGASGGGGGGNTSLQQRLQEALMRRQQQQQQVQMQQQYQQQQHYMQQQQYMQQPQFAYAHQHSQQQQVRMVPAGMVMMQPQPQQQITVGPQASTTGHGGVYGGGAGYPPSFQHDLPQQLQHVQYQQQQLNLMYQQQQAAALQMHEQPSPQLEHLGQQQRQMMMQGQHPHSMMPMMPAAAAAPAAAVTVPWRQQQ